MEPTDVHDHAPAGGHDDLAQIVATVVEARLRGVFLLSGSGKPPF